MDVVMAIYYVLTIKVALKQCSLIFVVVEFVPMGIKEVKRMWNFTFINNVNCMFFNNRKEKKIWKMI